MKTSHFARLVASTAFLLICAVMLGCSMEHPVRLSEIRLKPGCFPSDSIYTIADATLTPNGMRVPLSGGLVLRSLTQGRDTVKALVDDTIPVGTPITRKFHVYSGRLLGFDVHGPVLRIAAPPSQKHKAKTH